MSEGPVKPRRKWLKYSLRSFLLAVTAFCLWLGWNVNVVQQRKVLREQSRLEHEQLAEWQFAFINDYSAPPTPLVGTNNTREAALRYRLRKRDYDMNIRLKQKADPPTASKNLSWLRQWLGDEPVDVILVFNKPDHDIARARFPEAFVYTMPPRKKVRRYSASF